jgi:anti-anti-sigma factor
MFGSSKSHSHHETVGGVTIIRTTVREIRTPAVATEFGQELYPLIDEVLTPRFLINMSHTGYVSSTGFAVLVTFHQKVKAVGGVVKICAMDPNVRVGAGIIRLDQMVEIYDDEESALASF